MVAAIDFTGSNGDPDMPNSLHFMSPTGECTVILFCCLVQMFFALLENSIRWPLTMFSLYIYLHLFSTTAIFTRRCPEPLPEHH
jgi:hypothetical protein